MDLWKTDKDILTTADIEEYIQKHEREVKPRLEKLEAYYEGENTKIKSRKAPDPNNPDNKTPIPYGRKIVTTFAGYAYRPKYITYKPNSETDKAYYDKLMEVFRENNEHIKTSVSGKNTGIYGVAYEMLYVDKAIQTDSTNLVSAVPRFFPVEPEEIILLYDFGPEPKKKIGIRYYKIEVNYYKVEVYYKNIVEVYARKKSELDGKWAYSIEITSPNFFEDVPIIRYDLSDDGLGIFEPVIPLIDDYDLLVSDSMNEFDRFSAAYLILKKMSLSDPTLKKEAGVFSSALKLLKRRRVFENVPSDGDVKFLTKDIPTDFIRFMTEVTHDQIHVQSHVPDFMSAKMGTAVSGEAIKRMLFDFENVVSSAEATFDQGLYERIRLITVILKKAKVVDGDPGDIIITHKRNLPFSLAEAADTAQKLRAAGFSRFLVADSMPDDILPNPEEELKRQEEDVLAQYPDVSTQDTNGNPTGL